MYKDWLAEVLQFLKFAFITDFLSFPKREFRFVHTACGVTDRKHRLLSL